MVTQNDIDERRRLLEGPEDERKRLLEEIDERQTLLNQADSDTGGGGVGGFFKGLARKINEPIIDVPVISPAIQSVFPFIRRNITEPAAAASTVLEAPSALGLAGVPGFQDEFAFNPEQFPGQPEFRERFRENIPAGSRFLAEGGTDPLNLIPGFGLTRLPTRASQIGRLGSSVNVIERGASQAFGRELVRGLNRPRQLALNPATGRTAEGAIPLGGTTPSVRGPVSPSPVESTMVIVTPQNPLGERLTFAGPRQLRRAAEELGQRNDVQILPGNASPREVDRAASLVAQDVPPSAEVRTSIQRRSGGRDVRPRQTQSQLVGRLDPENLNEMRRTLRGIENEINTTTPGPRPNSPINQRLRALEGQATSLRTAIRELLAPELPNELDIPGIIRREPVQRIAPSTQTALPAAGIRPAGIAPVSRPGVQQVARPRPSGLPIEANTPAEAERLRELTRQSNVVSEDAGSNAVRAGEKPPSDIPAARQTNLPEPERVRNPVEAQQAIEQEFLDAVPDSPTDIAATAYMQTGKIDDYIARIPPSFEVAEGFAEDSFKEIGRVSAKMADPTRTIQAIDFGFFGRALQRGLLWPTRRTFLAANNWGDINKVAYRDILNTHNLRGRNPLHTRRLLDATGDMLEEIGTNELIVDTDLLVKQSAQLLRRFNPSERIRIVDAAKATRKFLDDLLDVQNAARAKRGQSEIPKLANYRPWIRNTNIWSQTGHSDLPAKTISQSPIPPDFIKPNEAFNPRAQTRTGGLEGYEKVRNVEKLVLDYVESARKDIFYTNIIQNGKAHIRSLRGQELENSAASIEDWIMESYAGKLPSFSKGVRENVPPPIVKGALALRRSLTRAVFPLNWTWNVFVQTSSAGLTVKNYGAVSTTQGLEYLFRPSARKWVRSNAYSAIIKRRGGGRAALQDVGPGVGSTDAVQRSAVETVESYANFLTNIIEDNLTGVSVRAAYRDGQRRGLTGRALTEYASEGGSKTQSMYNLEDLPGVLRAKEAGALFPFQTFAFEIMNTVRETGVVGFGRIGARTQQNRLISLAHWFGAMAAFNIVGEKLNDRQPWQLSSFIPFFSVLTAGADPSSTWNRPLPIKYSADLIKGIQDVTARGSWIRLRSWAIRYHMLGGTQIDRTLKGIEAVADGEVTDRRERKLFEVGDDNIDIFKAVTQGVYSTSEGREFIDKLNKAKGPGSRFTGIPTRRFFPVE